MDDPVELDDAPPAPEAEAAGRRMAAVRPEVDTYVRAVMRARASAELFGATTAVRIGRYELRRHIGTGGGGSVFVAWDPELAREVALKLIVAADPELRARALAEGQALAQLSHPNVVPVFDVGVIDERIYLVMELIRGRSLRTFADDARPREIVAAYRQCARGLAAAHAAKLVHRDFKPDNAVIGDDGRVCVIDFGLALDDGRAGGQAGTPRYMAPEQQRGDVLTAAVDQYAFAASLREAITPTPRWLDRIVARASAADPAARFPSMIAVDAALARDPRTVWRRRALFAAPAAIAIAAYTIGQSRESAAAPCSQDDADLAAVWSPARRVALAGHLDTLGTPYAKLAVDRLGAIDDYAGRWTESRHAGCVAHQSGDLSAATYDRRQICLASAKTELAALVELGDKVTADKVDKLVRAIPELPDLASCADVAALTIEAPPTQGQEPKARELRARLARARLRMQAGEEVAPELAAIVIDTRTLSYRPLVADALLAQGTAYLQQWNYAEAEGPLRDAFAEQMRSGDYRDAVEAYARLAWVRSRLPSRSPTTALEGIEQIAPLADGLPPHARFARALLHNNVGSIQLAGGNLPGARDEFAASIELGRDLRGPGAIELGIALENLALVTDDPVKREAVFAQRIAGLDSALGEAHPMTLTARIVAALSRDDAAAAREHLATPCRRLAELHPAYSQQIAECALELGWLDFEIADLDGARRDFAIARAHGSPAADGFAALVSGDRETAAKSFRALLADSHVDATTPSYVRSSLARLEIGLGLATDRDSSRQAFRRARALLEAALAVQHWAPTAWRLAWLDRTGR